MRFNELGKSGIKVSAVALGTWAMGGDFWGEIDEQLCIDALRAGLDNGINIIDTAPVYGRGNSERIVGRAIKGLKRDSFLIATKCGIPAGPAPGGRDSSRAGIFKEIEESFERLGTDYIDIYQIHWPDPNTPIAETMAAMAELKKQGKIRAIGVSNFNVDQLKECIAATQLDSVQPPFSLLDRDIEKDVLPFCHEHNIGVLSYGSLGAGMLTGKFKTPPKAEGKEKRANFYDYFSDPALFQKALALVGRLQKIADARGVPVGQVAINWVIAQPGMTTALVGCKNPKQAIENAKAGEWSLSEAELADIKAALTEIYGG